MSALVFKKGSYLCEYIFCDILFVISRDLWYRTRQIKGLNKRLFTFCHLLSFQCHCIALKDHMSSSNCST